MAAEIALATAQVADDEPTVASSGTARVQSDSLVERVARMVSGISVIGEACRVLNAAGWTATIAANRITVNHSVEAQLIPAGAGRYGRVDARWVVSSNDGTRQVWVVGAESITA